MLETSLRNYWELSLEKTITHYRYQIRLAMRAMFGSKAVAKLHAVLLAVCIILALVAVIVLSNQPAENGQPSPTRQSAIPYGALKMTPEMDGHPPILHSDEWMQPVPLGSAINTAGGEDSPFMLPDGKTLYFFFTPNVTVPVEKQLFDGVTGIYVSKQQNGEWGIAERVVLQDAGKLALDGAEFVSGNTMWFASAREGYTGVNLFTADYMNGKWTNWRYVGDKLMKDFQVGEMHITSDGQELYFHSGRSGGKGQFDIWVSKQEVGEWQEPVNVEAVNTEENEGWPFISQDGGELWFLRTYLGSPALYRSVKIDREWSTPELIVSQFAGEPTLDDSGNLYFVHHYYRNSTMIEADIYVAYKK